MTRSAKIGCSLLALLGPAGSAAAGDWPQFHGPRRDNISTETNLLKRWPAGSRKCKANVSDKTPSVRQLWRNKHLDNPERPTAVVGQGAFEESQISEQPFTGSSGNKG